MTTKRTKDVLDRLQEAGHTNKELAEHLGIHANTMSRLRGEDGGLSRRDDLALRYIELILDEVVSVLRSGPACEGTALSPLIEANLEAVNRAWHCDLATLLAKSDERIGMALKEPGVRVRFEHFASDAERIQHLLDVNPPEPRRWVMKVMVSGDWVRTNYNHLLDDDLAKLPLDPEHLRKRLPVWSVDVLSRVGWASIGAFEGTFEEVSAKVVSKMKDRGHPVIQWRSQRSY